METLIGSIVHFVIGDNKIVPAIVMTVYEDGYVNLTRFVDPIEEQTGALLKWVSRVPYSEEPKAGTWRHLPRE